MQLTRDEALESALFEKFRAYLGRSPRGDEVHVSDLLSPLLAYWKRVKPLPLTEDECLYFLSGIAHHTMLEAAIQGTPEESFTDEETGIVYSPDLAEWKGEIKTTRRAKIPETEARAKVAFADYIKQCKMYMVLTWSLVWKIIPFFYSVEEHVSFYYVKKKPRIRAYTLTLTEKELTREKTKLIKLSTDFSQALRDRDPSKLPLCKSLYCYEIVNGKKTGKCLYWDECLPKGRHPGFAEIYQGSWSDEF